MLVYPWCFALVENIKSGKCHLSPSAVTVLCANSMVQWQIHKACVRKIKGDDERLKEKKEWTTGTVKLKKNEPGRKKRERDTGERDRDDWWSQKADFLLHLICITLQSADTQTQWAHTHCNQHTHSASPHHRLLGCNQHTGYWSAAVNSIHCIHIDSPHTHTCTHCHIKSIIESHLSCCR